MAYTKRRSFRKKRKGTRKRRHTKKRRAIKRQYGGTIDNPNDLNEEETILERQMRIIN